MLSQKLEQCSRQRPAAPAIKVSLSCSWLHYWQSLASIAVGVARAKWPWSSSPPGVLFPQSPGSRHQGIRHHHRGLCCTYSMLRALHRLVVTTSLCLSLSSAAAPWAQSLSPFLRILPTPANSCHPANPPVADMSLPATRAAPARPD